MMSDRRWRKCSEAGHPAAGEVLSYILMIFYMVSYVIATSNRPWTPPPAPSKRAENSFLVLTILVQVTYMTFKGFLQDHIYVVPSLSYITFQNFQNIIYNYIASICFIHISQSSQELAFN